MREELQRSPEHSSSREKGMSRGGEGEGRVSASGGGGTSVIPGGEKERLGRARGATRDGNLPL